MSAPATALPPSLGEDVLARADALARHSDSTDGLTVAYLTPAHRAVARELQAWMREAGFDEVFEDAVGNVVGRYHAVTRGAKTFMVGSHFDTVRHGGRYDGRLGILVPIAVVQALARSGRRLPVQIEVVGFAEEEGLRFHGNFLGSSALAGSFDPGELAATDEAGRSLRAVMVEAGLDPDGIPALARDPASLAGYAELHIEQGPVLLDRGLALGVVSSIAGSVRMRVDIRGLAGHAGTTPMGLRRDAAAAAAEIVLLIERRCSAAPTLVGTVGTLEVPDGSGNVIPGRCRFSVDIRAADDATRDAAVADVMAGMREICARRGVELACEEHARVCAVPCDPALMRRWSEAVEACGLAPFVLPSGAGHDAMRIARITPVGMLFVRCGHGGISHNALETVAAEDVALAARALTVFLERTAG